MQKASALNASIIYVQLNASIARNAQKIGISEQVLSGTKKWPDDSIFLPIWCFAELC